MTETKDQSVESSNNNNDELNKDDTNNNVNVEEELEHNVDLKDKLVTDVVTDKDLSELDYEPDETQLMLTTLDNPFNPKTDYHMWKQWDTDYGHNTEEYIARLVIMDKSFDAEDEFMMNLITTKVINDILDNDLIGIYRLI